MLHGFSVPLTPQGNSALVSPPPWHYSSDCIVVEYWTDPAAITALLPPGLTPDEKAQGRAFFWFLDWQFTGSNDEITDPARYQYREAFVLVEALFERTPINYCPTYSSTMTQPLLEDGRKAFRRNTAASTNADILRAKCRRCPPCQGKPVRRQCCGARRAIGDGASAARGKGR
jgi:hypothetical protein